MKNEVAVVVGVGAALVKRFAEEGFTSVAVARRASSLTGLRGGDNPVILYDCDATVPEQVERLFQKIQSDYGPLGITVFNAGAFERREVVDTDPADFERCWRIGCADTQMGGDCSPKIARQKDRAEHGRARERIKSRAD